MLFAIKKCLTKGSHEIQPLSQDATVTRRLLQILCIAAKERNGNLVEQIGFHPIKLFRWLKKHPECELLPDLFQYWPANEENPFVWPLALSNAYQTTDSPFNKAEFIHLAQVQFAKQNPAIDLLLAALVLGPNSAERVRAARRLVSAGVDPNGITLTASLKQFLQSSSTLSGSKLLDLIEEVTPLALSVSFEECILFRELIKFGANPCQVSLRCGWTSDFRVANLSFLSRNI